MTRRQDKQQEILDAVLRLLTRNGISGVSIRAVAREAGIALGLVNYYFGDKTSLIGAALRRIEDDDIALLDTDEGATPEEQLRVVFRRVAAPKLLTTEYLSLRLQLWSLSQADESFAEMNTSAQLRYRERLSDLIKAARPDLATRECRRRAADIDVVQNGMWLSALIGLDKASIRRAVDRCEEIALQT